MATNAIATQVKKSVNWGRVKSLIIASFLKGNPDKAAAFVRGFLDKRLSVFTAAHLIDAIDHNFDLVGNMPENEMNFVRGMMLEPGVKETVEKFADMINADLVLQWLSQDRADLAGVLVSYQYPKGREWLEQQLRIIKRQLLGV